jgi:hypothetical protein
MLSKFKINTERDLLAPDFACYQMDLMGPVNAAIKAGEVDDEFKELPSWAKFAANPIKAKGFFTRTLQSLFLGQGGHDELNVDLQTEDYKAQRVSMMFMPANTRNDVLELIGNIAQETLPACEVIVLCGSVDHRGVKVNNRKAQGIVEGLVEEGKPVLIIAAQMAQRSFSIPEITELYLAYDRGESGSTLQKMSRTLTPGDKGKVGRIFSLSFDPNRDDKFDAMIVETAVNYKKRNEGKSLQEAMRDVLRTIDIFKCSTDGAIKVNIDQYLEAALARKGISRVLGKIVNLNLLSAEAVHALANGNSDYFRGKEQSRAESGKTREKQQKKKSGGEKRDLSTQRELAKAREVVTTILENLDIIIYGTDQTVLVDAMESISKNQEMRDCVEEEFGVPVETIGFLFQQGIIKQDWVELMYDNA